MKIPGQVLFIFLCAVFTCTFLAGQEERQYEARIGILPGEPFEHVNLASVTFLNPSGARVGNINVDIEDSRGRSCEIRKIASRSEKEIEIIFVPAGDTSFRAHLSEVKKGAALPGRDMKEARMLIDDFVPLNATKAGHWKWADSPRMSGSFSLTGKQGVSFQRILFPSPQRIEKSESLVLYAYCPTGNLPEEIMVEISCVRNKDYFFSWGKDRLDTEKRGKTFMGGIFSGDRWVRLEIPFRDIPENSIRALGLYNYGGRTWWDRISINEVPLNAGIISMSETGKKAKAFFNYSLAGPYNVEGTPVEILRVDASPSTGTEDIRVEISGKAYPGKTAETILSPQDKKRKVSVSAGPDGGKDIFEYDIPVRRQKPENVNLAVKVLPYLPFTMDGEPFTVVISITNLGSSIIPVEVKNGEWKEQVYPRSGETKHVYTRFEGYSHGDKMEAEVRVCGIKVCGKTFLAVPPGTGDIKLDGPFMKDSQGSFLAVSTPASAPVRAEKASEILNIMLSGSYPEGISEMLEKGLEKSGFNARVAETGIPSFERNHRLLAEYAHVSGKLNSSSGGDIFIFLPYIESMKHRTPPDDWKKATEAIISAAEKKFSRIIISSPFPSPPFPELFEPYRECLEKIAMERNALYIDMYGILLSSPEWKKMFTAGEDIYRNVPGQEGGRILADEIVTAVERLSPENGSR